MLSPNSGNDVPSLAFLTNRLRLGFRFQTRNRAQDRSDSSVLDQRPIDPIFTLSLESTQRAELAASCFTYEHTKDELRPSFPVFSHVIREFPGSTWLTTGQRPQRLLGTAQFGYFPHGERNEL